MTAERKERLGGIPARKELIFGHEEFGRPAVTDAIVADPGLCWELS